MFRLGFPGEVAPIDGEEKPSEDNSCEEKDTEHDLQRMKLVTQKWQ